MPRASCCPPSTACSRPSGISFGAGHIMDILRGKATEKVDAVRPRAAVHLRHRRGVQRAAAARRAAPADRHRRAGGGCAGLQHAAARPTARAPCSRASSRCCCANRSRSRRGRSAARARRAQARAGGGGRPDRRRPGALRGAQGLARGSGAGAQPAGLRDLPRRDAGGHRGAGAALAATTWRASAGSGRKQAGGLRRGSAAAWWLAACRATAMVAARPRGNPLLQEADAARLAHLGLDAVLGLELLQELLRRELRRARMSTWRFTAAKSPGHSWSSCASRARCSAVSSAASPASASVDEHRARAAPPSAA